MVYAYNLPNLGYGYDQYYYYYYSSCSSQNHHHVGPGDALLRGDASTPHLGGAHRSSSMPKDPFGNVDLSSHVVAALNATGHTQRYDVNHDTMFQTPNSQCFVKPIEETPVGAMAIMFIFISAVVIGAIPQYIKLIILCNADGLSMSSLALLNVSCYRVVERVHITFRSD